MIVFSRSMVFIIVILHQRHHIEGAWFLAFPDTTNKRVTSRRWSTSTRQSSCSHPPGQSWNSIKLIWKLSFLDWANLFLSWRDPIVGKRRPWRSWTSRTSPAFWKYLLALKRGRSFHWPTSISANFKFPTRERFLSRWQCFSTFFCVSRHPWLTTSIFCGTP